jgi:PAS domain S-box-containing protein
MFQMPVLTILILIFQLWLFPLAIFGLWRLTRRAGLSIYFLLLGSLLTVVQFPWASGIQFHLGHLSISFATQILFPAILIGLLLVYQEGGRSQAQSTFNGLLLVVLMAALIQLIYEFSNLDPLAGGLDATRLTLAAGCARAGAFAIAFVAYRSFARLGENIPGHLATALALLCALVGDALLFYGLAFLGKTGGVALLSGSLAGQALTSLALWPIIAFYFRVNRTGLSAKISASDIPGLGVLTRRIQLESRARHYYSLFSTLSQIHQLISRSSNSRGMLEGACHLLADGREYPLVWIGLIQDGQDEINPTAWGGPQSHFLDSVTIQRDKSILASGPMDQALKTGQAALSENIAGDMEYGPWRERALRHGFLSSAAFPMRHAGKTLGVLNVYADQANPFEIQGEVKILQEMADDLAYALVSLEARRQRLVLQSVAETTQDGLLITTLRGEVVYINPTFARILGEQPQDFYKKNILDYMTPEQTEAFNKQYWPSLLKEGRFAIEIDLPNPQGETVYYSLVGTLARDTQAHSEHIVISLQDTTNRKTYEQQLLTLNQVTNDMVQTHDPQTLLNTILNASEKLLGADYSAVYLLQMDSGMFSDVFTHNFSTQTTERLKREFVSFPYAKPLLSNEPVFVCDVRQEPESLKQLQILGEGNIRSMMLLPILYQDKSLGIFGLYYQTPHAFTEEEKRLSSTVTHTLAITLYNAQLYQSERSQRQLSEALANSAAILNSSLDLNEVLDHILEQTLSVIPCQSVNLMLIDGDQARVVRHLDHSDPYEIIRPVTGTGFPLTTPTLQQMIHTGEPILISNTLQDSLWRSMGQTSWIRSYAGTPLSLRQEIIGFLNVNSDRINFFTDETVHRLQAFASTAATAIQNARLFNDLQKHTQELEDRVLERTAEVSAAKERIERILVSVPDAVFVLNEKEKLVQANPAGEELIVKANQEGIDLFSSGYLKKLKEGTTPDEKTILEVQGRSYQALASSLPFKGHRTGLVIVFRDVTRFRELDKMKSEFVSDISHELRTPLTNLTIYLELLSNINDPVRQKHYHATLLRETERLTDLIEDLLTISRLEAGRLEITIKPVNVNLLVLDLANDRTPLATSKGLVLNYSTDPNLPEAQADQRLLTQVLSNLLTNALNYTPQNGNIHIKTTLQPHKGRPWVTVSISDTGYGILPEERDQIFDRFFRGSASHLTESPGTGLGLAISKEIVDRLGGWITVTSEPNVGSTFTVWLLPVL